jgi:RNA polymerase sigma-70 factor (sigma-E family)
VDFVEYVAGHRRALLRFATVLSADPHLADDVVADALATAFVRWDSVSRAHNPHAYMRRVVLNEYLGWKRRAARVAIRTDVADLVPAAADHAQAHADHQELVAQLRRLPTKQRCAIVLRYYEGLPFAEIAALLGTGENAVRSNISRGLRKLRVQLSEETDDAPGVAVVNGVR